MSIERQYQEVIDSLRTENEQLIQLLKDLQEWSGYMGGFEAKVWRRVYQVLEDKQ